MNWKVREESGVIGAWCLIQHLTISTSNRIFFSGRTSCNRNTGVRRLLIACSASCVMLPIQIVIYRPVWRSWAQVCHLVGEIVACVLKHTMGVLLVFAEYHLQWE